MSSAPAMDYSFGNWIKRRRKALDLTREDLARRVGCSESTIFKIEADERRPSRQIAELLAEHLMIPSDQHALFLKIARRERMVENLDPLPVPAVGITKPVLAPVHNLPKQDILLPAIPLVGRDAERNRLADVYRRASQGQAQTVCLTGEAGMGKTRLANTFLDWASQNDPPADVLRGRAFETGGRLPYQPVADALRARVNQEEALDEQLPSVWLAELSQLLPELHARFPGLSAPLTGDPDFVRARLFEAVTNLTITLAAQRPLVLFIDDLQWTDTGTRDLLHYLAHRWSEAPTRAVLLLTARQEDLITNPVLQDWLTSLGRDTPLKRLELAPLAREDLHELMRAVSAVEEGQIQDQDQLGDWLLAETGGSPFFLAEMLQMLREQELLVPEAQAEGNFTINVPATLQRLHSAGRVPLPPNVRGVILARLGRLSDKAKQLLLAGAVIGRQCSFERLCQVARLDEFDGLPALEELLKSRLMLETGDEARPFSFAHDNLRDVVYTEAGVARRQLFHRQAFTVLEQNGGPSAELAFHAAAARLHEPAFRYALAAGDAAMSLHAFADAVVHYKSALEWAEGLDISSAQRCHLCTQHGRALELSGRYPAALAHYEAMAQLARRTGDSALELAALVAQGTIRAMPNEFNDPVLGERLAQQALELARELGDKTAEARIQWNLVNLYRITYRHEQALAAGVRSLALARDLGWREGMAFVANDLAYVYTVVGDVEKAMDTAQTANNLWRELGNLPMLTDSLASYANTLAWTGSFQAALEVAGEGLQIGRSLKNLWAQSNSLIRFSFVYWRQMAVDQALSAMQESIRLGREAGFLGAQAFMGAIQAQMFLALGDTRRARQLAQEALETAQRQLPHFLSETTGTLALVAMQEGNLAEASEILAAIPANVTFDLLSFLTRETALCQHYLCLADYERANSLSCQTLAFLRERRVRMYLPDFLYFQGQALAGLGQVDDARQALEEAVSVSQAIGSRWNLWEIAALLADLAEARGDQPAAGQWLETARTTIREIAGQISDPALRAVFLEKANV